MILDLYQPTLVFLSDLANLVNIAAIKAAVDGAEKLNSSQLEFAKDRIVMGTERKTMFLSEESKKVLISEQIGFFVINVFSFFDYCLHFSISIKFRDIVRMLADVSQSL